MNYISLEFWTLLAVLLAGFALVRLAAGGRWHPGWDRWYLLAASLILFAAESVESLAIFLGVGTWVFVVLRFLPRISPRLMWPVVGMAAAVALLPLVFYKYLEGGRAGMLIPIGISFYTFQLIGMLVDSAREPGARVGLRDFFNFAAFFPQIVAGPIERRAGLLPQLQAFRFRWCGEAVELGVRWVVLGLFYKLVVADNLAGASGWIVGRLESPWLIHLSNLVFGLRIYFDFCGYSLIALGIGRALGVELTVNFLSPYTQRNIREFWRTWHVSLSRWFRDYVYVPLGGNRARFPVLVLAVVFLVSGVWHGAGWNFVMWGAAHAVFFMVFRVGADRWRLPALAGWMVTTAAVTTSWLFFYQLETAVLLEKLERLVAWRAYLESPQAELLGRLRNLGNLAYLCCAALLGIGVVAMEALCRWRGRSPYAWGESVAVQALLVVLLVWVAPVEDNGFVYFNF